MRTRAPSGARGTARQATTNPQTPHRPQPPQGREELRDKPQRTRRHHTAPPPRGRRAPPDGAPSALALAARLRIAPLGIALPLNVALTRRLHRVLRLRPRRVRPEAVLARTVRALLDLLVLQAVV